MKHRKLILLAVLLAAGCIYFFRAEKVETRNWPSTGISAFYARTSNGEIALTTRSDTGITATITRSCMGLSHADAENHLDDIVVSDSTAGNGLYVKAEMPTSFGRNYSCEFAVQTPETCAANLETTNGALTVTGVTGDVRLSTTNGAVKLTNIIGAIDARTTNGAVTLTNTSGRATLVTTDGAVTAAPHAGSITAATTNGAVDCDLSRFDSADVAVLHSSNGRVTVSLPSTVSVTFDATTTNGEVTVQGFAVTYTLDDRGHKRGTIGAGLAALNITTSNGNVTIRPR